MLVAGEGPPDKRQEPLPHQRSYRSYSQLAMQSLGPLHVTEAP